MDHNSREINTREGTQKAQWGGPVYGVTTEAVEGQCLKRCISGKNGVRLLAESISISAPRTMTKAFSQFWMIGASRALMLFALDE
jgi:hypothetical protein